ncbi:MAG TPA: hypothetical protein VG937_23655 [Polyangiaceae bacterium]|nr:hypothetical protein [Polyangiaceae bacterium]
MLKIRLFSALFATLTTFAAGHAAAQDYTHRSFLTREGGFEITGEPSRPQILRIDVSRGSNNPIHLAPHFYWGVARDVTIGITHRDGFCVAGCDGRRYNDVGFGLLINLSRSANAEIDFNTGVQVRNFDPFHLGWKGGVLGRVNFSPSVAFVFDPTLYVGVTSRDTGNREQLVFPFWFYFQATPTITPFVGAMLVGPLDHFGDNLSIPVEGGVLFKIGDNVDIGAYFRFHNLLGSGGNPDGRELGMLGRFQF